MMQKEKVKALERTIILIVLILVCLPWVTCAKTVLKMNHQFPATAAVSRIDQWFVDEIKQATGGEIEILIFWSNGLGEAKENLAMLQNAEVEMAGMSAGYFPTQLPFFSAPNSIPMSMSNICEASLLMDRFIKEVPAFKQEALNHNIRPLFFHTLNPYLLVSKTPVRTISDLKGMRIRTWGKDMPQLVTAVEAIPVTLFLQDIHGAFQHNVLDGCPFSLDLVASYKIFEFARHITEIVMWEGPSYGLWINENIWQRLSFAHKEIFLKISEKARLLGIPSNLEAEKKAKIFLEEQGVIFHSFPLEEVVKWKNASPDFFDAFIRDMAKKGKEKEAKQTVDLWRDIVNREINCQ